MSTEFDELFDKLEANDPQMAEIKSLRTQLTTALAERDEARHMSALYKEESISRAAKWMQAEEERDEARERVKELEITLSLEEQSRKAGYACLTKRAESAEQKLDTAWQQGAEAMREEAATRVDALAKLLEQLAALSHIAVQDNAYQRGQSEAEDVVADIRALPVPERKEG